MNRIVSGVLLSASIVMSFETRALETDIRLKLFGSAAFLPSHDIQRQQYGTPAMDLNGDMRLMFRQDWGFFKLQVDHSTTFLSGDSYALVSAPQTSLDQTPVDDDARIMDLTFDLEEGSRHRSFHRLDRLALQYRKGNWGVTLGRQAVSWGNGLVFSPLDLLSPFAPTVVDQDYKAGEDLLLVERLFKNGSDMQFLAVGRRAASGDISWDAGSAALKWHTFAGDNEIELFAAKHYQDLVLAIGTILPLGSALLRSDIVVTRLHDGDLKVSGIVNLDYSMLVGGELVYLFAEYYRNGFGVSEMPASVALLPAPLQARLVRGEVFNIMRDYGALGVSVAWHPLVNQSLTLLLNLNDSSSLLQTSFSYEPGDHQRLQMGLVLPLGRAGDEFGGIPLAGSAVTSGGGARLFFRWLYYF